MSGRSHERHAVLGFSIERIDHTEGERYYRDNNLLFAGNDVGEKSRYSTEDNPVPASRSSVGASSPSGVMATQEVLPPTRTNSDPGAAEEPRTP